MKYNVKELETCRVELTVEVESDIWQNAQNKAFKKLAKSVKVDGFRPGKAPEAMLRARVNPNSVINEALNMVLDPVYGQAITENNLRPFARPDVNVTKVSDTELTLVFTFTTVPEVTLGAYKGLKAERKVAEVSEDEVAAAIAKRLEGAAELEIVEREAKLGDTVVLDFKGFIDGVAFEGGEAENYALELGSNSFVPGFEDALVGVKSGDSKDVNITFPTQYVAELAGKDAVFQCVIHEVKEKKIPTLSDEAVKDLAIAEVETVEALKEYEKKNLLEKKVNENNAAYYNEIVKQIVAGSTVKIAASVVEGEANNQEEQTKKQVESNGLTWQQYLDITGQKEEDLHAKLVADSENNLKTFLVLNEIARVEHMIVDDAELDVELAKMASQYKMKLEDIKQALGGQIENFRENLQSRKIQDFLLANNA